MVVAVAVAVGGLVAAGEEVTFESLLGAMTDRAAVTRWPAPAYRSLQASSYHRDAKTPDDPKGWFANGDQGFVLRVETNRGVRESVLMEHDGPGVLTRIWTPYFYKTMANREGPNLRIYVDGEPEPVVATNFIRLVTGRAGVPPPFAQETCRAGDLYLPIPFARGCKVTVEGDAFFYLINYRAYEPGTKVESFRLEFLKQHQTRLEETGRELTAPAPFTGGKDVARSRMIAGGAVETIDLPAGPSALRHLELRLQATNRPQALRSTVLEAACDGENTIWCPVGDFFSNVNGIDPFRTWEREVRADGTMICRWIMPYREAAALRVRNLAAGPVSVDLRAVVSPWEWTTNSLHFHTTWWTGEPRPPRPVWDMNFVEVNGRGIHVGDTLVVLNPLWSWWGEGDEKIFVDDDLDRRFPSHFGTGSEDYYGWAGGVVPTRKDEFSAPFLANVRVGGQTRDWPAGKEPHTHGYNICTRSRSLDATPFARRFKFDMEAFNMIGTPDALLQYALVTHWYAAPGATHNRPPLPAAAAAPVPQTEDVAAAARRHAPAAAFRVPGAIELEGVREIAVSPGLRAETQRIGDALPPYRWSDGAQFWARATRTGEWAAVTLLEQYQPKRILLYPTISYDYGTLDLYVNDTLAVAGWDGFDPVSRPAAPVDLGVHAPDGGAFQIKGVVAGRNPKAKGFFFGWDCVVLRDEKPK